MKPNLRLLFSLLLNLAYLSFMVWVAFGVLTRRFPWFWVFGLIALLSRWPDVITAYSRYSTDDDTYSIALGLQPTVNGRVTPELITEMLANPNVVQAIRNDLAKTGQIGYKEEWRLGLISPDQDRLDPNLAGHIPLRRTAVLHSTDYFKHNNICLVRGEVMPLGLPKWSCGLETKLNKGEFISIRRIRVEANALQSQRPGQLLPEFLREDGFPLR